MDKRRSEFQEFTELQEEYERNNAWQEDGGGRRGSSGESGYYEDFKQISVIQHNKQERSHRRGLVSNAYRYIGFKYVAIDMLYNIHIL